MHNLDLILTLARGFTAALILGYLTRRAGLSPIVGYLLAGTFVGPHTPGFVANAEIAEQLAEVGNGDSHVCGHGRRCGGHSDARDMNPKVQAHRELFGKGCAVAFTGVR